MRAWLLGLSLLLGVSGVDASPLWVELDGLRADLTPSQLDPEAMREAQRLFADLAALTPSGEEPADLDERAARFGLSVQRPEHGEWLALSPSVPGAEGFYVFRLSQVASPLVLQAPHAWYDLRTGRLGCLLFEEGAGQILMTNSGQRYAAEHADLAHQADTLFQAATQGVSQGLQDPLILQLHGFGSSTSRRAAVVSPGSALYDPAELAEIREGLDALFRGRIGSGDEVPDLAGRTNAQGVVLSSHVRFLHLELSSKARKSLVADADLRAELAALVLRWADAERGSWRRVGQP